MTSVDTLYQQADQLKEEGKYDEAISKLAGRSSELLRKRGAEFPEPDLDPAHFERRRARSDGLSCHIQHGPPQKSMAAK